MCRPGGYPGGTPGSGRGGLLLALNCLEDVLGHLLRVQSMLGPGLLKVLQRDVLRFVPLVRFRAPATCTHRSHLRLLAPSGTRRPDASAGPTNAWAPAPFHSRCPGPRHPEECAHRAGETVGPGRPTVPRRVSSPSCQRAGYAAEHWRGRTWLPPKAKFLGRLGSPGRRQPEGGSPAIRGHRCLAPAGCRRGGRERRSGAGGNSQPKR